METKPQQKVLIVEDEVPLLKALSEKFLREGFAVIEARDGALGLGIALHQHPDIILLDILLPTMDGLEVLRKLRTEDSEYGKNVPVVILTNLSADDDKINDAVAAYHPAYYLVKTEWTGSDVVDKVKERLGL